MIEIQPLTETALARETLRRIADDKGSLRRAEHVLGLVARSSIGLGEVLQDYAAQGYTQVQEFIRAAVNALQDAATGRDRETLQNIHYTLKSVKSVLEMIPAAMQRNKLMALGEKDKFSRADITEITHHFLHSADIVRLLADERSGDTLAALVAHAAEAAPSPNPQQMLAAAGH